MAAKQAPDPTTGSYIIQSVLLLLGPSFFVVSIYVILVRIIRSVDGESNSIIRIR